MDEITRSHEILPGAVVSYREIAGRVDLVLDGKKIGIADPFDRTEVAARMFEDMKGARGLAFVEAVRSGDIRAQRRTWREIGKRT